MYIVCCNLIFLKRDGNPVPRTAQIKAGELVFLDDFLTKNVFFFFFFF